MDIALEILDTYAFDHVYAALFPATAAPYDLLKDGATNGTLSAASTWVFEPASRYISVAPSEAAYLSSLPRDNIYRQFISLFAITWVFGLLLYFVVASMSYYFIFDKTTFKHPKFLKNQIRMEMSQANTAMPVMSLLTAACFTAEVRGHSKLFDTFAEAPNNYYVYLQVPAFLIFTDFWIYLIHRGLHWAPVYKRLHKPHHKWIMPTPFASHAFHPLDGFAQSIPYHVFPFLFPLQKLAYVALFVFINAWTILIHDGEYVSMNPVVNGAACHTMHHLYFNFNYGQYSTLWDRLGGTYRKPNPELFSKESKMGPQEWARQVAEMEKIVKEVEGSDERSYGQEDEKKMSFKKYL